MNEQDEFMNRREEKITLTISADSLQQKAIYDEFQDRTGTDNPYDNIELYRELTTKHTTNIDLWGMTWQQAQAFAEPLRIAHPDQCISLSSGNSFIGNTTWNDQMKMFWEYSVYTPYGEKLKAERLRLAEQLGQTASWE